MDFHRLQQKLFELDPTDPKEDLAKLQQVAQGGSVASGTVEPTKDYLRENAEVAEGSLKMDRDYSVSDFAALAGVKTNEATPLDALKHGFKNYNKLDALNTQVDGKKPKSDVDQIKDLIKGKDKKPTAQQPTQQPAQAQPSAMPTSNEGYTLKAGDDITYVNKKGQRRTAPAVKMLKNLDTNGKNVIQLELNGATFAISRDQIIAVNGRKFTLTDPAAGKGKLEALEARVAYLEGIIETLVEGKKVPSLKPRDPNAQYMTDLRKSGAMGAHKDKKKDAKAGKVKHKGQPYESIKDELYRLLDAKK